MENLANFDENSCFSCAKRCERTRTVKKHRKLPGRRSGSRAPGGPTELRIDPGGPQGSDRGGPIDLSSTPGGRKSRPKRPKSTKAARKCDFRSIWGRFQVDFGRNFEVFRGFSSRLARFLANMLTLSKHRVGRVQIDLRRGAYVENLEIR